MSAAPDAPRRQIRLEIAGIEPLDELEREHIARALAWLDSGAELCRRIKPATPAIHLASYCVAVDGEFLLLVDHEKARRWLPTGGNVESGELPRYSARRELEEELGLVPAQPIPPALLLTWTEVGRGGGFHTDVTLWYPIPISRDAPLDYGAEEFHDARWFHRSAAPLERAEPHLGRFLAKLGAGGDGYLGSSAVSSASAVAAEASASRRRLKA